MIDFHTHISFFDLYSTKFLTEMLPDSLGDKREKFVKFFMSDKNCTGHLNQMKEAGIQKSVLLIIDSELGGGGKVAMSIDEIYDFHGKILKTYKDRLEVFAGVDPRRENALEIVENGVKKFGFSGLKLYPPMGFYIYQEELLKLYEYCEKSNLPVLIHTGPSHSYLENEKANPNDIKHVVKMFPRLKVVLAHAGYRVTNELSDIVLENENVNLDISGFQNLDKNQLGDSFDKIFSKNLNERMLFGSDWPLFHSFEKLKSNVETIFGVAEDLKVSKDVVDNLMYLNARKILNNGD